MAGRIALVLSAIALIWLLLGVTCSKTYFCGLL